MGSKSSGIHNSTLLAYIINTLDSITVLDPQTHAVIIMSLYSPLAVCLGVSVQFKGSRSFLCVGNCVCVQLKKAP